MESLCEVCKVDRAVVYCKSDVAKLCLHCDGNVHSANRVSRKHTRSLICGKCSSEPAIIRCANSAMYLCESCDSCSENGHHQHQKLDSYSGCPSPAELMTKILSRANNDSSFRTPTSSLSVNEGCSVVATKLNKLASCLKFVQWAISTTPAIPSNPAYLTSCNIDQGSSVTKQSCRTVKDLGVPGSENFAKGVDLDELSSDSSYKIFSSLQQNHSSYHSEEKGLDCLVLERKLSPTGSSSLVEPALEASSGQQVAATAKFILMNPSCNKNIGLVFPPEASVHSKSLSLSNITGESSAGTDSQDCGLSPLFLTNESSRDWRLEASFQQARNEAKMRYNEKKKSRTFNKKIRYASRKAKADTRKRVKGKFVKPGEDYDYDPVVTKDS